MAKYVLKKKNNNTQEEWIEVFKNIENYISKEEIENKINETIKNIKQIIKNKNVAYSWSGGKDSIALEIIMEKIGIKKGVCAISEDLEYTDFLNYIKKNIPTGVEIINKKISIDFLNRHSNIIFPQNKKDLSIWYKIIQHKVQDEYFKKNKLDILILGRRLQDGNYVGKEGIYSKMEGTVIYSPLYDWKHEEILALIHYYNKKLPNFYFTNNGFNQGTHNILSTLGNKEEVLELLYNTERDKLIKLEDIKIIKEFLNEKR